MNQCDICEEMGCRDCENCSLGNPCYDCEDYDRITKNCTSNGGCADMMGENKVDETNNATYHAKVVMKAVPRWIPLKERKPSEEGEYLVSFDDGFVATTGYYDNDFELWADAGEPLAWQPLPEAYREEER